jgi:hypothetical protein
MNVKIYFSYPPKMVASNYEYVYLSNSSYNYFGRGTVELRRRSMARDLLLLQRA